MKMFKKPLFTDVKSSFLKAAFAIIAGIILGTSGGAILSGDGERTLQEEITAVKHFFGFE
jgi:hypothetical protein